MLFYLQINVFNIYAAMVPFRTCVGLHTLLILMSKYCNFFDFCQKTGWRLQLL